MQYESFPSRLRRLATRYRQVKHLPENKIRFYLANLDLDIVEGDHSDSTVQDGDGSDKPAVQISPV
jgi:hypothetical protein